MIRIVKRIIFWIILAVGMLFGAVKVEAQESTPTPTRTINPDCWTPGEGTQYPGQGEYDLDWIGACGECLPEGTPTPDQGFEITPLVVETFSLTGTPGTGTPAGTQTVIPGGTETPTPTSTTPTPTPEPYYWAEYVGKFQISRTGSATWQINVTASSYDPVGVYFIATNQGVNGQLYWRVSETGNNLFLIDHTVSTNKVCQTDGVHSIEMCQEIDPGFETGPWGPHHWHYSEITGSGVLWFSTSQCGGCESVWDLDVYYIYWSEDVMESTPTPTPTEVGAPTMTPTLSALCQEYPGSPYAGQGIVGLDIEGSLEITPGTSCYVLIPGFSLSIPEFLGFGPYDLGWAQVELCPVWVTIPDISIATIDIPFEALVILPVFVFALAVFRGLS